MIDDMETQDFLDGLTEEDIENMERAWLLGVTCVPEDLTVETDKETLTEVIQRGGLHGKDYEEDYE